MTNEEPEQGEPAPLPIARSELRPVKAWKVWAVLFGIIFGSTIACVGGTIAYGFFLDYKSR